VSRPPAIAPALALAALAAAAAVGAGSAGETVPPIPPLETDDDAKPGTPEEWSRIEKGEETEAILREGTILWKSAKVSVRPMSWIGPDARKVVFSFDIAHEGAKVKAQGKVPQTTYNESRGEVLGYRVARRLGITVPAAAPRVYRKAELEKLGAKLSPELLAQVLWGGKGKDRTTGSVRLWVERLSPRVIGKKVAEHDYLVEIARALHPGNRAELLGDARYGMYLDMGRGFVLDYLVNNNDRMKNLGTYRLPGGPPRLLLIDFGLAFGYLGKSATKKVKSAIYFKEMRMLPGGVLDRLATLTKEELDLLLRPPKDKLFRLPEKTVAQIWERREAILARAAELETTWGEKARY